jgi:hypothetical protein
MTAAHYSTFTALKKEDGEMGGFYLQYRFAFLASPRQGHGGLTPMPLQHDEPFLDRNEKEEQKDVKTGGRGFSALRRLRTAKRGPSMVISIFILIFLLKNHGELHYKLTLRRIRSNFNSLFLLKDSERSPLQQAALYSDEGK